VKIASSDLFLRAEHAAVVRKTESETLRSWTGTTRPDFEGSRAAADGRLPPPAAVMRISDAARALASSIAASTAAPDLPVSAEAAAIAAVADEVENDPFLQLIKSMVEMLTGEPVKVFSARQFSQTLTTYSATYSAESIRASAGADPNTRAGWGAEYDYHAVHEEAEITTLSAAGVIRTADGKEMSFHLDLTMQRSYREETHVSIRAGDAVRRDPLVINFGGTAAQLSDRRFAFDLLGDGVQRMIPLLAGGSGYLALDRNGNDRIDSGNELFGPASGAGFAELANLDSDGNGWIDENDAAFDKLGVWTPDANADKGQGALATLRQAGVGAIGLGHVTTPFELRGSANADLGAVCGSGVWLADDGAAGSVQEIDLTV